METNLREVLLWAETTHDEAVAITKEDFELFERLEISLPERKLFISHISAAFSEWQKMSYQDKWDLIWAGEPKAATTTYPQWADRPSDHIEGLVHSFDVALAVLQKATAIHTIAFEKGRRRFVSDTSNNSTLPLEVFATILKAFWEESTGLPFGQHFSDDSTPPSPLSAPANFLVEAASHLSVEYTNTQIRTVMRNLQKKTAIVR